MEKYNNIIFRINGYVICAPYFMYIIGVINNDCYVFSSSNYHYEICESVILFV